MRTICFYFQVHQPYRLRWYRFFDIGNEHYYYDDFTNKSIVKKIAERCYLPANQLMLELIKKYNKKFKIAYSISGTAISQFEMYAPEVLESFQQLAKTGCVEFLAETDSHSLASLKCKDEFIREVYLHSQKIEKFFGQKPKVFRNTELIYSDSIGEIIADLGFKAILAEGAKHILGWKSPNFLYYNSINPKLKLLLRNYILSDDIAFRFSNQLWEGYPLTADKYVAWLNSISEKEETVNIFMDYETFGEHQPAYTGIFDFMRDLPGKVIAGTNLKFATPSEVAEIHQPIAALHVPYATSWADEERDITAWTGNDMQKEAVDKLFDLKDLIAKINDAEIQKDWANLKASDHFYYISTKFFSDGAVHQYFNPYSSPYDAFINFMNVLTDFTEKVKNAASKLNLEEITPEEAEALIVKYQNEITRLKSKIANSNLIAEKEGIVKEETIPRKKTVKKAEKTEDKKIEKEIKLKKETKPKLKKETTKKVIDKTETKKETPVKKNKKTIKNKETEQETEKKTSKQPKKETVKKTAKPKKDK